MLNKFDPKLFIQLNNLAKKDILPIPTMTRHRTDGLWPRDGCEA